MSFETKQVLIFFSTVLAIANEYTFFLIPALNYGLRVTWGHIITYTSFAYIFDWLKLLKSNWLVLYNKLIATIWKVGKQKI